jgi:Spy/CpxP family protein refolding chaperone
MWTAAVLTAVLAVSAGAQAPGGGGPAPDQRGWGGGVPEHVLGKLLTSPKVMAEVGLTEAQAEALREKAFGLKREEIKLRAELELAAMDQAKLVTGQTVKEADLMAAVEKTGALRTELAKLHMRGLLLIRETLTPEQREKLRKMAARRERLRREGDVCGGSEGARREVRERKRREWREGKGGPEGVPPEREPAEGPPPEFEPEGPPPEE